MRAAYSNAAHDCDSGSSFLSHRRRHSGSARSLHLSGRPKRSPATRLTPRATDDVTRARARRFAGAFSEGDRTITVFETDSSSVRSSPTRSSVPGHSLPRSSAAIPPGTRQSTCESAQSKPSITLTRRLPLLSPASLRAQSHETASTELMSPHLNSYRISDVSLDRFGYDAFGGALGNSAQMQMQQRGGPMIMAYQREYMAYQQQQQRRARGGSFDSTSSSSAAQYAQQWGGAPGQPRPHFRVPWQVQGPPAGYPWQPPPPPPPPPRPPPPPAPAPPATPAMPSIFARFGARQGVYNGPQSEEMRVREPFSILQQHLSPPASSSSSAAARTDSHRLSPSPCVQFLLSAPTEYANTLAATTELATSFDGATDADGGAEVMSRYQPGPGSSTAPASNYFVRGGGGGGRSSALSGDMSEGFESSAMTGGDRGSEGRASYYNSYYADYDVFDAAGMSERGAGDGGDGASSSGTDNEGRALLGGGAGGVSSSGRRAGGSRGR